MRKYIYILTIAVFALSLAGCDDDHINDGIDIPEGQYPGDNSGGGDGEGIPEGYFEVVFGSGTRAPITGQDGRIKDLLYILYNSTTNAYIKERHIKLADNQTWPVVIKDTLPKGVTYKAVFFGNVDKTLYPYTDQNGQTAYMDIVYNYNTSYDNGRIRMPNAEMPDDTEIYKTEVTFNYLSPKPRVLLQRATSNMYLGREYVTPDKMLGTLMDTMNVRITPSYKTLITDNSNTNLQTQVNNAVVINDPKYTDFGGYAYVRSVLYNYLKTFVSDYFYNVAYANDIKKKMCKVTFNDNDPSKFDYYMDRYVNIWHRDDVHSVVLKSSVYTLEADFPLQYAMKYTNNTESADVDDFKLQYKIRPGAFGSRDIVMKSFISTGLVFRQYILKAGAPDCIMIKNTQYPAYQLNDFFNINSHYLTESETNVVHRTNRRYKTQFHPRVLSLVSYSTTGALADPNRQVTLSVRLGDIPGFDAEMDKIKAAQWPTKDLTLFNNNIRATASNIVVTLPVMYLPSFTFSNFNLRGYWDHVDQNTYY